jgi:hypothetical protein
MTGKKAYQHFSFASKNSSWHRPDCYPIWDSRVRAYLLWLQKEWSFAEDFEVNGNWKYAAFLEVIARFRKQYKDLLGPTRRRLAGHGSTFPRYHEGDLASQAFLVKLKGLLALAIKVKVGIQRHWVHEPPL